jgi:integrase
LNDYLKLLNNKKDETSICSKGYVKNHLYPYWSKYNFKDITQEKLINYQSKMLANGYSIASIKRFVSLFQKIIKKYSEYDNLQFSTQDTILPSLENRVLTDREIEQIIKDDTKIQELWILATGINTAELGAIEYSDIDFQNKTVNITKVKYKDKIENIRAKYKIRSLKLPTILLDKIPKNKKGIIFESIRIDNFDILLNTHIKLMLNKNVQINIISRNLGFYKLTEFENRYNFLLPQELDNNFQIL